MKRRGSLRNEGRRPRPEPRAPTSHDHDHHHDQGHEVTYGLRAGLALLGRRPADVGRVLFDAEVRTVLGTALRPQGRPPFEATTATDAELTRLAGTKNHEGLVVLARPRPWVRPAALAQLLRDRKGTAIALDRVRNPYNVGAILRSAAFFGVDAAILGAPAPHPAIAPDALRVAEGGAEHLALCRTTDLAETLHRFAASSIQIVGADQQAPEDVRAFRFERPTVLVVGHELGGLSPRIRERCAALVAIRGSGAIESLNVAVAAGVAMSALVSN